MLQDRRPGASLSVEAEALLQAELHEHRMIFEATSQMLSGPFMKALGILETALRRGGKMHITIGHVWCKALEQRLGLV